MYNSWTWSVNNETMVKTKRKDKIKELSERMRDNQIENLKQMVNKDEKRNNKELSAIRLMEREKIKQRVFNPFLCNNNYLNDLNVQENYLKPQNSSYVNLEI